MTSACAALATVLTLCSPAGHPILAEMYYDAPGDDTGFEFIEIFNPGTKPVPLSQPEVDRILHHGAPAGGQAQKAQVEFSLGESVKVTSGPLSDFDGEIVDVNPDQQKLKVLVDIFERQVPVELSFDQVKKID